MSRQLSSAANLDNVKREAKRWLKALRSGDEQARERLRHAYPQVPEEPALRHVQHALAAEYGFVSWAALKARVGANTGASPRAEALCLLLRAAGEGDLQHLNEVLDTYPDLVNERGTLPGHTGLRTALHFGVHHEAVVKTLLDRGADPNVRDEGDNAFPLHFAAERGNLAVVKLLVEHGAETVAGHVDDHELDVIGWATCFGRADPEIVQYLLAHGARHTIFSAVAMNETAVIRDLVPRSRGDLERAMDRTNHRRRPLHLAVVKKRPEALRTLLDLGADVNSTDAAGLTPLDQAALDGESEMAQLLIDRGSAIELPAAVSLGRLDDIRRLLREDPDCLKSGKRWGRLIIEAAAHAGSGVIERLIREGASVNVRDALETSVDETGGYTALHAAAFHGNPGAVAVLLRHGADPTIRDSKYCSTPAGWANYAGRTECRDQILDANIDMFDAISLDRPDRIPSILERDPAALSRPFREYASCSSAPGHQWWPEPDTTPLDWATATNKAQAVRILMSRGAELAVGGNTARTHADRVAAFLRMACLDWAVGGPDRAEYTHAAGRLLRRHPEIARDSFLTAVVCGEIEQVQRVLAERRDAASKPVGPRGWPPLLYLCSTRLPDARPWSANAVAIARALLDHGADPTAYYCGGNPSIHYTALTCVVGRGEEQASVHPRARELAALLLERGAEPYDVQFFYNAFAGHASHRHLADDDFVWLLELIYQHSIRRSRERDWQDPDWKMLDMGGYGSGTWYLLSSALKGSYVRIAEWVLSHGGSPNPRRAAHRRTPPGTLYEQAVSNGLTAFAELLARYGAEVNVPPSDPHEEFVRACLHLDGARVKALVAKHADYARDPSPLMIAAERDRPDIVEVLLDVGMSPNLEEPRTRTRPLHLAAYNDAPAVVRLLIERGAEIDPRDAVHGTTPLYWAYWGQRRRTVDLLAPLSRDVWALTCLGKVDRLRELLSAEPQLAKTRDENDTILFYLPDDEDAAAEIVRLLLAHGADPSVRRKDGTTAGQVARARGLDAAADLLGD